MTGRDRFLIAALSCVALAGCRTTETGRRSFVLPAAEIVAMDAALNLGARRVENPADYQVTAATIRRNLRSRWVVEDDPFEINQFLHPYQGAMYHGIARSSGLNYWQSAAYTFAGSALWEIAGETTLPSKNDQIASGIAGSFLGESLFRTARLILFHHGSRGGFLRTLGATLVSPPTGVNRVLFGDRFESDAPGSLPPTDLRLELGVAAPIDDTRPVRDAVGSAKPFVGFAVDYGFPGSRTYAHSTPFDHFRLEGIAASGSFESLAVRGVLAGKDIGDGEIARGLIGLYGGYDFFAPAVFRVSSTNITAGTASQINLTPSLTLQATALAGVGYTAAQSATSTGDRDYTYGVAPQAVGALRLIAGTRAAIDIGARQYFISDIGGFGDRARDRIFRGDATVALRLARRHGVALKFLYSQRSATAPSLARLVQRQTTVGVLYTFLGSGGFGAQR